MSYRNRGQAGGVRDGAKVTARRCAGEKSKEILQCPPEKQASVVHCSAHLSHASFSSPLLGSILGHMALPDF